MKILIMKQTQKTYKARVTALLNFLREQNSIRTKFILKRKFNVGSDTLQALVSLCILRYDENVGKYIFSATDKPNEELVDSIKRWTSVYHNNLEKTKKRKKAYKQLQLDMLKVRKPRKKVSVWRKFVNKIKSIF